MKAGCPCCCAHNTKMEWMEFEDPATYKITVVASCPSCEAELKMLKQMFQPSSRRTAHEDLMIHPEPSFPIITLGNILQQLTDLVKDAEARVREGE